MYIGRFAPTPSGSLHFGSLVAALASYLDARKNGGKWLVRIEDLDFPRNEKNADSIILQQLEDFGMEWDDKVLYQSSHLEYYEYVLQELKRQGQIYACNCRRKDIAGKIYLGSCRTKKLEFEGKKAWRLKTNLEATISWEDGILQKQAWRLGDLGEPVLKRRDGIIAYQLAVVADDEFSNITHVVRGEDLLTSTPWQILLFRTMQWREPKFAHISLARGDNGKKLSKQNHAPRLDTDKKVELTIKALEFLNQIVPQEFYTAEGRSNTNQINLLNYAVKNWNIARLAK